MDDFDHGMELPDDELMGESTPSDMAGAEAEGEGGAADAHPRLHPRLRLRHVSGGAFALDVESRQGHSWSFHCVTESG